MSFSSSFSFLLLQSGSRRPADHSKPVDQSESKPEARETIVRAINELENKYEGMARLAGDSMQDDFQAEQRVRVLLMQ